MKAHPATRSRTLRNASIDSLADLIGTLKKSVSVSLTREFRSQMPAVLIHRAVEEAEQVARETGFPHLFLPELAAEQVRRIHAALTHEDSEPALHRAA